MIGTIVGCPFPNRSIMPLPCQAFSSEVQLSLFPRTKHIFLKYRHNYFTTGSFILKLVLLAGHDSVFLLDCKSSSVSTPQLTSSLFIVKSSTLAVVSNRCDAERDRLCGPGPHPLLHACPSLCKHFTSLPSWPTADAVDATTSLCVMSVFLPPPTPQALTNFSFSSDRPRRNSDTCIPYLREGRCHHHSIPFRRWLLLPHHGSPHSL